ncbi:hypothetical protein JI721_15460 [Alicyclobacillus cycloheptanicus]|uniref:Uncharacterized protein (DUF1684 family) n=1 Tax=Alicyclobacillus cycloheptanicus TaxID=1457 RepID=A0ABT9XDG4_9BACL|nr:hypothetical protein [Alicyclobacillus cycloheptanicus]MDQ0188336.1 uncharacterized protein (DUF1684 family) [Alicyclobacillus cycloheptanicus]WDM01050.1 hypothetical protein JI721_15460 [Alicyclobacillus cycloheptanicus]
MTGTIVVTLCVHAFLSLWLAQNAVLQRSEDDAMWASLSRVLRIDGHAAAEATLSFGGLNLQEADGTGYRYEVNKSGQYVRIESGGGTSVIAVDVRSVTVQQSGGTVHLQVTFQDGTTKELFVCTLAGNLQQNTGVSS